MRLSRPLAGSSDSGASPMAVVRRNSAGHPTAYSVLALRLTCHDRGATVPNLSSTVTLVHQVAMLFTQYWSHCPPPCHEAGATWPNLSRQRGSQHCSFLLLLWAWLLCQGSSLAPSQPCPASISPSPRCPANGMHCVYGRAHCCP